MVRCASGHAYSLLRRFFFLFSIFTTVGKWYEVLADQVIFAVMEAGSHLNASGEERRRVVAAFKGLCLTSATARSKRCVGAAHTIGRDALNTTNCRFDEEPNTELLAWRTHISAKSEFILPSALCPIHVVLRVFGGIPTTIEPRASSPLRRRKPRRFERRPYQDRMHRHFPSNWQERTVSRCSLGWCYACSIDGC